MLQEGKNNSTRWLNNLESEGEASHDEASTTWLTCYGTLFSLEQYERDERGGSLAKSETTTVSSL